MPTAFLRRGVTGFCLIFIASACSRATIRSDYGLNHYDELVVSDSQSQLLQPRKLGDGRVEINHIFLVKNTSTNISYELLLNKAAFKFGETTLPAKCKDSTGKQDSLNIESEKKYRVDCLIRLVADDKNQLALKDQVGILTIPYAKPSGIISFKYFLKIEDFE